jgi:BlaI family transcriptional regulator, penicillinase repressor
MKSKFQDWIWLESCNSYLQYDIIRSMDKKPIKPTESELEILNILWEKGEATVREVHEELSKHKDAGYTTTLKLMQIMFEKRIVTRDDSSKTHIYAPAITREKTQEHLVGKMINSLFAGSPGQLVMQALGNHQASPEELDEIQKLLDNLKKQ